MNTRLFQNLTSTALIALIFLCLAWEAWLAPLRPGGSWMTLKAVFLLAPLFGILRGKRYTYKWLSLFIQFYLLEGLTRATSDQGLSQWLATGETILALLVFIGTVLFLRSTRVSAIKKPASD
ncbi:DUF2069 domain-containing protein [Azonexus sp.]|uniref:DUF2069 domain-containing protein n=1 Tax=Azonexus sp. TaxID=1872668 RepID=UPI0027BAB513|nr:DUF2069 domain-containing protein [Azonexus sp.]